MDSPNYIEMCVPKDGEELIYIQQRLESEVLDLVTEYNRLNNLTNPTATLCDVFDASWIVEEQNTLTDKLKEMRIPKTTIPETKPEKFLATLDSFRKGNEELLESLMGMNEQVEKLKKEEMQSKILLNQIKNKSMDLESGGTDSKQIKWDLKSKKDFQTYRQYLHRILELCFEKTNLKNLVQDLTSAYFKGGDDKYIDISESYSFKDIEILEQASLISSHPSDKMKIKFRDFK